MFPRELAFLIVLTNLFSIILKYWLARRLRRISANQRSSCHGAMGWCDQYINKPSPTCTHISTQQRTISFDDAAIAASIGLLHRAADSMGKRTTGIALSAFFADRPAPTSTSTRRCRTTACSKPSPAPTRYYAKEQAAIDQLTAELSLVEPLQVAMDNGARRALVPLESKRDFLEVSADIVERVNPIFFSDPMTAAMKALGMT